MSGVLDLPPTTSTRRPEGEGRRPGSSGLRGPYVGHGRNVSTNNSTSCFGDAVTVSIDGLHNCVRTTVGGNRNLVSRNRRPLVYSRLRPRHVPTPTLRGPLHLRTDLKEGGPVSLSTVSTGPVHRPSPSGPLFPQVSP